jgi:hypothetical protein
VPPYKISECDVLSPFGSEILQLVVILSAQLGLVETHHLHRQKSPKHRTMSDKLFTPLQTHLCLKSPAAELCLVLRNRSLRESSSPESDYRTRANPDKSCSDYSRHCAACMCINSNTIYPLQTKFRHFCIFSPRKLPQIGEKQCETLSLLWSAPHKLLNRKTISECFIDLDKGKGLIDTTHSK